jgi:CxxC-x17-CxxC domain-containing protein
MDENTNSRPMFQGDWNCSNCNTAITELPFQPNDTSRLTCRDCYMNNRASGSAATGGERVMHEGNWKCSACGGEITKLPFEPRDTGNLKCLDCYRNK